jgi:hypothetical protein
MLQTEGDNLSEEAEETSETQEYQTLVTGAQAIEFAQGIKDFIVNSGHPELLDQVVQLQYALKRIQLETNKKQTSIEQFITVNNLT